MSGLSHLGDAVLDAIEDPALVVDGQRVVAANRAARALLGAGLVGRDLRFAIRHPVALDTILTGRDAGVDLVGIGAADRPWHLTVRALGAGVVLARLSDRSAALAAERMRTDFVANASHELRTPLATIIGYAETLAEDGPVDDALRMRFGATIHGEARRMLRIVEDLMSLSRIEAGRFDLPEDIVDLAEVARLAIDHSAHLAARRGCTIGLVQDGPIRVRGDFGQLLQLADNLIANALRYGCTRDRCTVDVLVGRDGDRALLSVRDQGDGIGADHVPRLTERFYRVDAARSRDAGGTGLGLAIVKHIVERHRGTLAFDSAPGRGTAVSVALPLVAEPVVRALS
jgi:two-component system phosphate regulon sensor histidine kinase PhoR